MDFAKNIIHWQNLVKRLKSLQFQWNAQLLFYDFSKNLWQLDYICGLSIALLSSEILFHSRVTECHFVQLGNLCPNSKCWHSSQVQQTNGNVWTTWRAVWGENSCIPVRKGPQQDWRISTGFKFRWSWGFWWLGIQVQTERNKYLENMFHTT